MKKINLLAVVVAGAFAVACNGGSSSGGSSAPTPTPTPTITPTPTPTPSDACSNGAATCGAPAGSVPTVYSQAITPRVLLGSSLTTATFDGTLSSTTNLYLSSAESYPLIFTVTGNTVDITVDFTIVADDANIPAGSPLPTMTPHQCVFTVANPAACNLSITLGDAPVGKYKVIPHVIGATEFAGVEMNFQAPTQFTLPLGTYLMGGQSFMYGTSGQGVIDSCSVYSIPANEYTVVNTVNGVYACINNSYVSGCSKASNDTGAKTFSLPSATIYTPDDGNFPAHYSYMTNANWNGSTFLYTDSLSYSACNGLLSTQSLTFQSSSTILPYPVVNQTALKIKNVYNTMTSLLGGFTQ
ncbi:MAG: hypothetical protein K2X94_04095 [Amoebophilaceae bacterium]|nr:hypothetical protein [Amoebophilaceae bacterium]